MYFVVLTVALAFQTVGQDSTPPHTLVAGARCYRFVMTSIQVFTQWYRVIRQSNKGVALSSDYLPLGTPSVFHHSVPPGTLHFPPALPNGENRDCLSLPTCSRQSQAHAKAHLGINAPSASSSTGRCLNLALFTATISTRGQLELQWFNFLLQSRAISHMFEINVDTGPLRVRNRSSSTDLCAHVPSS